MTRIRAAPFLKDLTKPLLHENVLMMTALRPEMLSAKA